MLNGNSDVNSRVLVPGTIYEIAHHQEPGTMYTLYYVIFEYNGNKKVN
jgi:hypothetical protein